MKLLRKEGSPLYFQIKSEIKRKIEDKEWQPGDLLPTETELEERFSVSRTTVRQAISELQIEGYVSKQQGKGTFVTKPKYEEKLPALRGFTEDVRSKGHFPRSLVINSDLIIADQYIINKLKINRNEQVLKLVRLRFIDEEPIQITTEYIPGEVLAKIEWLKLNFSECSLYEEMEKAGIELDEANEIIEAQAAEEFTGSLLKIPVGAPLLISKRQTFDINGKVVEYAISQIRGDRYQNNVRLKRKGS
ncbi:MAG: GntR family transcriptional regulator [Halanaerobiales bacterium]|nr:GntR family transcriptional regulator [Halanaerobiales bacterium]